ncbi:MAG: type VI secretion system tube protein Hcp [Acidobacteria bacterium]|nr:type VI secretion system tube protein Hcp [Acidobacteriota bacterium]
MAYQVYATVTAAKQGVFKGDSTQKGHEGKIKIDSVSYGVVSPRDAASGLATGKRVEQPVVFSLNWNACSPQFFGAAYSNENLTTVLFEYFSSDKTGVERLDHTVKLTNASIAEIREAYAAMTPTGAVDGNDVQTVSLTFQKIEITNTVGGITAVDDWQRPAV